MKPRVSVLVDTYNQERFIERALASVFEQDFPAAETEVLVVDDGSTDRTPEILRRFQSRVRVIRKSNGGQASAFNVGIPEARADVVAFLDGDDWWAPNKLTVVMEAMTTEPTLGIVGHGIVVAAEDGSGHVEALHEGFRFRAHEVAGARLFRLRKSFMGTSRMAIRTELLRRIGPVPDPIVVQADEYLFTLAAVLADARILPEALTYYRIHDANGYQMQTFDQARARRKHSALDVLARSLASKLRELGIEHEVEREITEIVQAEADRIRLSFGEGWSWETVLAEWRIYDAINPGAPPARRALKAASLLPALLVSPRRYYRYRQALTSSLFYARMRRRWSQKDPFPHVGRAARSD